PVIPTPSEGTPEPPLSLTRDLFVGVDLAHSNSIEAIKIIEETAPYTNLIVFGASSLSDLTWLACDKGLSYIQYWSGLGYNDAYAREVFGDLFLGTYPDDECGGRTVDQYTDNSPYRFQGWAAVKDASDYHDAANRYVTGLSGKLKPLGAGFKLPFFTTDYALYWFDYKAGFDVVLAQLGSNCSKQLNIALCRGAAAMQNKDWGVIITWKYNVPPYIESGAELYNDLILAYNNGAKYIVVYDADANHQNSILKPEHLQALKQFWQYAKSTPRSNPINERVAFVLPKDYGFSFRNPEDKIWGKWKDTQTSTNLYNSVNLLLEIYGPKLDIIYDDELTDENKKAYSKLIYPNDPIPTPALTPSLTPTPTTSPFNDLNPSASPSTEASKQPQTTDYLGELIYVTVATIATIIIIAMLKRRNNSRTFLNEF
ncbi:MAG: hypothetical protein QXD70_05920, partial [Candidatus Bathyarchaeia archaeon]